MHIFIIMIFHRVLHDDTTKSNKQRIVPEHPHIPTLSYKKIKEKMKHFYPNHSNYEGFYVEAGAVDGFYISNTLYLDYELNWTGLLIEPDPVSFKQLLKGDRKAWKANCCLSSHPYPYQVSV